MGDISKQRHLINQMPSVHDVTRDKRDNQSQMPYRRRPHSRLKKSLMWAGAVLVFLALVATGYFIEERLGVTQPDKNSYQAVFLTNGQVYFGKLDNVSRSYLQLVDIYYLQANQSLQAASSDAKPSSAPTDASGMQLIKLGSELHGPKDKMQINKDQVLFWEDLKADSKVAEAIASYKK